MKTLNISLIALTIACLAGCVRSERDQRKRRKTSSPPAAVIVREAHPPKRTEKAPPRTEPEARKSKLTLADCPLDMDPRKFSRARQVRRMIECASLRSGVPADIIFGIWSVESGGKLYGEVGSCNVLEQYRIRRAHGKSDQVPALRKMAKVYGWNLSTLLGSCGTSTLEARSNSFGGCLGPKQITPSEWIQEPEWWKYDPMNAYHAMIVTSWRLQRHHDLWLERNPGSTDQRAWRYAVERYIGGAGSPGAFGYYSRVVNGRGHKNGGWGHIGQMGWWHWTRMRKDGDFSQFYAAADRKYHHIDYVP